MTTRSKQQISALAPIGIDIGKDVFHLVGFASDGKMVLRRKIKRLALAQELKKLPPTGGRLTTSLPWQEKRRSAARTL